MSCLAKSIHALWAAGHEQAQGEFVKKAVLSHIKDTNVVDLATCDGYQPRVRPMTLICYNERFFFATGATDEKCAQIASNPNVEFCLTLTEEKHTGYIRAAGFLEQVDELAMKKTIADFATYIYHFWSDPADAGYRLYEMKVLQVQYIKPGEMLANTFDW